MRRFHVRMNVAQLKPVDDTKATDKLYGFHVRMNVAQLKLKLWLLTQL